MKKKKNCSGQSTIEFVLTFMLMLTIIFMYVQLALGFTWANFIHYATFMAARAYQASGSNLGDHQERAKDYLVRYIKKSINMPNQDLIPQLAKASGGGEPSGAMIGDGKMKRYGAGGDIPDSPEARKVSWMSGVTYSFTMRLFMIPLLKFVKIDNLSLTSESWLGREESASECAATISGIYSKKGASGKTKYDNGC